MLTLVRPPFADAAQEQLDRPFDAREYDEIKQLWLDHISAEHAGSIPGLMATLTDDCEYVILNNGQKWHGHKGATEFYGKFLGAFPENCFKVINTFIGPQGVVEEAHFDGVLTGSFMSIPVTGQAVQFHVTLMFPWDRERRLFKGERIYFAMEWSLIANMGQLLRRMAGRAGKTDGAPIPGIE
ncbi:MAG: ester cyclase [Hyphomicrobium sp.]